MSLDDDSSLRADAALFAPLARVAYRHGMMLGVEAVRDEQAFHRRRLNRHQYWLHGTGTVVGLAVTLDFTAPATGETDDPDTDRDMRLLVSPGIALDGLGREVVLHEGYCLDLRAWIEANRDPDTRDWNGSSTHIPQQGGLWLEVSIRAADCDRGLQPVLAHEVNAGIDPVATSRIEQGVRLDIRPITPADAEPAALAAPDPIAEPLPGAMHPGSPPDLDALLTQTELDYLDALADMPEALARFHAARLYRLRGATLDADLVPELIEEQIDAVARVLLARIRIETLGDAGLVSHPSRVAINNLVRPFVTNPDALRWLLATRV